MLCENSREKYEDVLCELEELGFYFPDEFEFASEDLYMFIVFAQKPGSPYS